jgi:hypothetical protein
VRERDLNKGKYELGFCGSSKSDVAGFGGAKKLSLSFEF